MRRSRQCLSKSGDFTQAVEYYEQSLRLKIQLGGRKGKINSLGSVSLLYFYQNKYGLAIQDMKQALAKSQQIKLLSAEVIISSQNIY